MEQEDDERARVSRSTATRNELSGRVSGPVIQAGYIFGDVNVSATVGSPDSGVDTEGLSEELRQSSQVWRSRFSSVDFVNLPRMPMLSAGEVVIRAARRARLDDAQPFGDQGMRAGEFVRIAKPLFETWDAEAVVLDASTAGKVRRGMLVSYEAPMRCRNAPRVPLKAPTGDLAKDPHLVFRVGEHRVVLSFDPRWLTTSTANTTLHDAVRSPQIFSGLGQVAAVSEDGRSIRVSALVFGQPQTLAQAQWEHAISSSLPTPRGLTADDFRNELSVRERTPPHGARPEAGEVVDLSSVALFFDEDELLPGQADRAVLIQVSRIVSEYRRDVSLAVASLLPPRDLSAADLSAQLLAREPALWKTFTVPGLTTLIKSCNLAVVTVAGISRQQAVDLDEVMREDSRSPYVGAMELDQNLQAHQLLFPESDDYHLVGAELRLKYSAGSRVLAEANGEDLDEPLEQWRKQGLFQSVVWEEDMAQSAADEREASLFLQGWFEQQSD
ncbi:hypothetical protein [Streptomyces antarcticus]|uniref:hypothetical protein n=1 Tax=Streptomyces antarcticus TaxID=2996458 RepID=UPI00226F743D|nr:MULTISPECIES: hypothetical protein [unclassified Streptomyces]MCY0946699.1 hypothetical protein [Streptomyces sp. H34-AA3]MCZ4085141.1 hypothetical protein [Streptomyces sp. H34-S5]